MDNRFISHDLTEAEAIREAGRALLQSRDPEERDRGFEYVLRAYQAGDAEAAYLIGRMAYDGLIEPEEGDAEEGGISALRMAAMQGHLQARALLNVWCRERNGRPAAQKGLPPSGPLRDFDGNPVRIDRKGVRTPIDAVLAYSAGLNRLTLSANLAFLYSDGDVLDPALFEQAVMNGFRDWEGDYLVFGDQPLRVTVELTAENRLWDNIFIIPLTEEDAAGLQKRAGAQAAAIAEKRSFAVSGFRKWSVHSRKLIFIQSENGRFDDPEEIRRIARHEFGHALGLGDLYEEQSAHRAGVPKGTYKELDGYHLFDRFYDLVMCSGSGPVSNNDIEMVVLAFRENEMQLYQPQDGKGKASEALGRGN